MAVTNQSIQPAPKKRSWFKICCFSCLGIFILAILVGLSIISATGLIKIPVFSWIFYHTAPQPIRVIQPMVGYDYEKELEKTMNNNYKDPETVKLEITEEAFTSIVGKDEGNQNDQSLKKPQVAIEPTFMEVYGTIGDTRATLIVKMSPKLIQGGMGVDIQKVKIGKVPIPSWLVEAMLNKFTGGSLTDLMQSSEANITDIKLESKKLIMTLDISNKIKLDQELEKTTK